MEKNMFSFFFVVTVEDGKMWKTGTSLFAVRVPEFSSSVEKKKRKKVEGRGK